ncbi:unnamed protein product [Arabis nemorensis]|uniref:Uncharacterized protein n=1 Tax=Arabis nemorensis TaxID=586526 RepID=A0A565BD23_9BRAS|nr:unnamed protein product [Arabis nemorensis]
MVGALPIGACGLPLTIYFENQPQDEGLSRNSLRKPDDVMPRDSLTGLSDLIPRVSSGELWLVLVMNLQPEHAIWPCMTRGRWSLSYMLTHALKMEPSRSPYFLVVSLCYISDFSITPITLESCTSFPGDVDQRSHT